MFYVFGGSKTLVKRTFFIMILTWDIQKHWQAPKKQTTRCTKHRQAPKKNTKNPATTQKWTHSSWIFFLFFLVPVQVCVCLDLGYILNWCFKEANIQLSLAMPPHRLPDLNSQQHDTILCIFGFLSLSNYWNETADKTLQDNNDKQDMYLLLEL